MTDPRLHALPAFERHGTGEPLVLLHGLGSARTSWYPVLYRLAAAHDVVAVDLPGFGESPLWPDTADWTPTGLAAGVSALLDELGLTTVHLAGISLGGWVALELAAEGRARSVTAFAPAGLWRPGGGDVHGTAETDALRRFARLTAPLVPLTARIRPLAAFGLRHSVRHPMRVPRDVVTDAARALARARGYRLALAGTRQGGFARAAEVPSATPVTVVFGDDDRTLGPDSQVRDLAPAHATWHTWPDTGHMPVWEHPDRAAEVVLTTTGALTR